MELGSQIKKYRSQNSLSQDALAERIYVSRQTISNWENDKSYPDVKSLILLSEVFQVSIDNLIKGDLKEMKQEIDKQEYAEFQRDSMILTILFAACIILPVPLVMMLKWVGLVVYLVLGGITMYFALRIEKYKKKYDIQTYKEILAFNEGKSLTEIEKVREVAKRPYQKVLLAAGAGLLTLGVVVLIDAIAEFFL